MMPSYWKPRSVGSMRICYGTLAIGSRLAVRQNRPRFSSKAPAHASEPKKPERRNQRQAPSDRAAGWLTSTGARPSACAFIGPSYEAGDRSRSSDDTAKGWGGSGCVCFEMVTAVQILAALPRGDPAILDCGGL